MQKYSNMFRTNKKPNKWLSGIKKQHARLKKWASNLKAKVIKSPRWRKRYNSCKRRWSTWTTWSSQSPRKRNWFNNCKKSGCCERTRSRIPPSSNANWTKSSETCNRSRFKSISLKKQTSCWLPRTELVCKDKQWWKTISKQRRRNCNPKTPRFNNCWSRWRRPKPTTTFWASK